MSGRCGITLIELLVVIAIIGVLIALLLPAVQMSREAAQRTQCKNNLYQITVAVHNYCEVAGVYPPSFCIDRGVSLATNNGSWSIHGRLLPFLEQGNAFKEVRLGVPWDLQLATGVPTMAIGVYRCPSDVNSDTMRVDAANQPFTHPQNSGFNFGTWHVYDPTTGQGSDGVFSVNSSVTPSGIVDGLSHTLCAAEVKAFQPYIRNTRDPGPTPPVSPSFAIGYTGQLKLGPQLNDNTGHTEWCDVRVHHSGITTVFTPNTFVRYNAFGREFDIDFNSRQEGTSATQRTFAAITARSWHKGVVHAAMMDGSVRAISDAISPAVWRALGTRAGQEHANDTEF
jgi:prepilin-type N-terminal cleavage/methylation domain-containing protein